MHSCGCLTGLGLLVLLLTFWSCFHHSLDNIMFACFVAYRQVVRDNLRPTEVSL